jgi:replicative DNA helicase
MNPPKIEPGYPYTGEQLRAIEDYLAAYEGDDRVVDFAAKKTEVDALGDAYALKSCQFPTLSREIAGFVEGELVLVSGPTAGGKTLFLQSLHSEFAATGVPPIWFSYEVCPRLFFTRFCEAPHVPKGYLPRELSGNSLPWLYARIWEAKIKHGCRVAMIDHLHYIIDMALLRNPSLQIGAIVRGLKRIAVELGVIIFLIQHMREIEPDQQPAMRHIRDTGMSIREADTVLMIWRLASEDGRGQDAMLKIEKARRTGVLGRRIPILKAPDGRLVEIEKHQEDTRDWSDR